MAMPLKRPEVTQPVSPSLAMLCKDALEFDSDLNNHWRAHPDNRSIWRRPRSAGAGPDRNINDPIVLTNLLVMT
jgi:hypothetical protein